MKWLRPVSFANGLDAVRRDMLYERLCFVTKMIERVETTLDRISLRHHGAQLPRAIPGVGPRTAEAVMAWVDDPSRFQRNKSAGRYFRSAAAEDADPSSGFGLTLESFGECHGVLKVLDRTRRPVAGDDDRRFGKCGDDFANRVRPRGQIGLGGVAG